MQSMTAFGRSQIKSEWGTASWELRSINHRYLEINVQLPDPFKELAQNIREIIGQYFQRGKIECSLYFYPDSQRLPAFQVNYSLLGQLIDIVDEIGKQLPDKPTRLNLTDLLGWRGVIVEPTWDTHLIRDTLLSLLTTAAVDLQAGRLREGKLIECVIKERLQSLLIQVQSIEKRLPYALERQREKILERFKEAQINLDPLRLEQEMLYFTQKMDIAEEIDRTLAHIAEVRRTLSEKNCIGRRLDFMMQELNREANTLASKSADTAITHAAVEMKVLIEQMREQVQNIE